MPRRIDTPSCQLWGVILVKNEWLFMAVAGALCSSGAMLGSSFELIWCLFNTYMPVYFGLFGAYFSPSMTNLTPHNRQFKIRGPGGHGARAYGPRSITIRAELGLLKGLVLLTGIEISCYSNCSFAKCSVSHEIVSRRESLRRHVSK